MWVQINLRLRILLSKLLATHVINYWVWCLHLFIFCLTLVNSEHFLVMDQNLWRETFNDPLMHKRFNWWDSFLWVPLEALTDEVLEWVTLAKKNFLKRLARRNPQIALRIFWQKWLVGLLIKEHIFAGSLRKYIFRGQANDLHNQWQLLLFTLSREEWNTREKFCQNATKAPHIYRSSIWNTQNDLRCSVEPRLDVSVNSLIGEATWSEIDHLNPWFIWALQ